MTATSQDVAIPAAGHRRRVHPPTSAEYYQAIVQAFARGAAQTLQRRALDPAVALRPSVRPETLGRRTPMNPLLAGLDRALRPAAVRRDHDRGFRPGLRRGAGRGARQHRRHRRRSGGADLRQHHRGDGAGGAGPRPGGGGVLQPRRRRHQPGDRGVAARPEPAAFGAPLRDDDERGAVRPGRRPDRAAGGARADRGAGARADALSPHVRARRGAARRRGPRRG